METEEMFLESIFQRIVNCQRCKENANMSDYYKGGPIPAAFGENYRKKRILILAQNPGVSGLDNKNIDEFNAMRFSMYKNWSWTEFNRKTLQDIKEWRMYKWLSKAGINYEDCAFVELYKCSFRDNKHFEEAADNCKEFTMAELKTLNPRIIITIGDRAYQFIEEAKQTLDGNPKIFRLEHTSHRHPGEHDKTYHGLGTIRREVGSIQ